MAGVSVNKVFCVIKQDWLRVEKVIPIGNRLIHLLGGVYCVTQWAAMATTCSGELTWLPAKRHGPCQER